MKTRELEKDELPEITGVTIVRSVEFEIDLPELTFKRKYEINANDDYDK